MEGHTTTTSRQCKGMSDPEGDSPNFEKEPCVSATASDAGPRRGTLEFDDPMPEPKGKMEEEHTSNTR